MYINVNSQEKDIKTHIFFYYSQREKTFILNIRNVLQIVIVKSIQVIISNFFQQVFNILF